jgi:uncharacterized protein
LHETTVLTAGTIFILIAIGITAGMLSVGGGMVIVPALIYFLGLTQFQAQGTSLAIMIPPIGILAVMNYWKTGNVDMTYAVIIAVTFIIGGYLGSKFALRLDEAKVKLIFGLIMLYASVRMIWSAYGKLSANGS